MAIRNNQDWERHFPIKRKEEHKVTRRQFAVFCGCSAFALGAGVPLREALRKIPTASKPIAVARENELPRGSSKLFRYPTDDYPCLLIKLKDGNYVAYSQSCTHLMCPVHFDAVTDQIVCPCHQGFFDPRDGSVMSGPPQRALPRYQVRIEDEHILVGPEWELPEWSPTDPV